MSFENIKVKKIENLSLITINRPQKYNAISLATLSELERALDKSANDNDVKVIAFTGEGEKAFASGSDLSEVKDRNLKKALEQLETESEPHSKVWFLKNPSKSASN